jgi:CRP-like cAMP-binding protein
VATARPDADRRNYLLAALLPADFALLKPNLKDVTVEHGSVLQEQDHPIEQVYFPHSGMISLLAVMQQGEAIETATVGREGAVGAIVGLGPRAAFTRAVMQVPGSAARIASTRFQAAANRSEAIRNLIIRYNEVLLAQAQQTAACNAVHDVEARLCRWLLQTRDRIDTDTIPLTQEFLAQMLGVRRTTVTLIARTLQTAGLVRYNRGRIEILDRAGLEESSCECYEIIRRQNGRPKNVN